MAGWWSLRLQIGPQWGHFPTSDPCGAWKFWGRVMHDLRDRLHLLPIFPLIRRIIQFIRR